MYLSIYISIYIGADDSAIDCSVGFYHCARCHNFDQCCNKHGVDTIDDHAAELKNGLERLEGLEVDAVVGFNLLQRRSTGTGTGTGRVILNWNSSVGDSKHFLLSGMGEVEQQTWQQGENDENDENDDNYDEYENKSSRSKNSKNGNGVYTQKGVRAIINRHNK